VTTFQLWPFVGTGLLVPCASGFEYSNQAAGMLCRHPSLEGAFVPMSNESSEDAVPHVGCCGDEITEEHAAELDAYFAKLDNRGYLITVDRERLADSTEAWVWVQCKVVGHRHEFHPLSGYEGPAVFTWENCD
jgi:hypothetical protein